MNHSLKILKLLALGMQHLHGECGMYDSNGQFVWLSKALFFRACANIMDTWTLGYQTNFPFHFNTNKATRQHTSWTNFI